MYRDDYLLQTFGQTTIQDTTMNAARCLEAFGAPNHPSVHAGMDTPLIGGRTKIAFRAGGRDGLEHVHPFPTAENLLVLERIPTLSQQSAAQRSLDDLAAQAQRALDAGEKIHIGLIGPATNIAPFLKLYPELAEAAVAEIVWMGRSIGVGE